MEKNKANFTLLYAVSLHYSHMGSRFPTDYFLPLASYLIRNLVTAIRWAAITTYDNILHIILKILIYRQNIILVE